MYVISTLKGVPFWNRSFSMTNVYPETSSTSSASRGSSRASANLGPAQPPEDR
jgi:hypothetical protein